MKLAPIVGVRLLLSSPPNALSVLDVAPKLYVSPPVPEPVPAVYVVLWLVPVSLSVHPVGSVLEVPEIASVLKS